ncbi:hypothetical protein LCGC14_1585090, partial [marine sediment metagenome]
MAKKKQVTTTISTTDRKKFRQQLLTIGDGKIGRELFYLVKSRYRIIYIRGPEENRVINTFKLIAKAEGYDLHQWDISRGLIDSFTMQNITSENNEVNTDAEAVLDHIIDQAKSDNEKLNDEKTSASGGRIYLLLDFHHYLNGFPSIERKFKEFSAFSSVSHIVIVSPIFECPPTLDKEFTLMDFPPPSMQEIKRSFDTICLEIPANFPNALEEAKSREEELLKATTGLTISEAENAYAKSLVKKKSFDIPTILDEKKQIIRKGGILEYRESRFSFDQVGGLDALKEWLEYRKLAFKEDAREFGLDPPKGVLLIGIPGCVLGDTKIRIKDKEEKEIAIEEFFASYKEGIDYQIETPNGWQSIGALIRKRDKECYNLILNGGLELGCSDDHYVLTPGGWTNAEDIKIKDNIITKYGVKKLLSKEYLGKRDTFDLEVKSENHSYYSNDIVSHNTGKSMTADALSHFYEMPLLRLDIGALFSAHVGDSEKNARDAIQVCEAVAPCVIGSTKVNVDGEEITIEYLFHREWMKGEVLGGTNKVKETITPTLVQTVIKIDQRKQISIKGVANGKLVNVPLHGVICTKKKDKLIRIEIKTGEKVIATRDHILMGEKNMRKAKDFCVGDLISTNIESKIIIEEIASVEEVNFDGYVYDAVCESPHLYVTNGFISHNCILWIDEIEKGLGGVQSSNLTDGGVTNRVFGTLLTWMQEKTRPVFVVATANNVTSIPPEFMRAGRFDEIFFLDLPDLDQRIEVLSCLLLKKNRNPDEFDLRKIATVSDNYSPAELEKGINNALFLAYSEGERKLKTEDIVSEIQKFQPLYNSRREEIDDMRDWALGDKGSGGRARLANAKHVGRKH